MSGTAKTYRVWIVDDEQGMCLGAIAALENYTVQLDGTSELAGFQVEKFFDGESFLSSLANDRPDIVLLDNKLPDIQGIEILEKIVAEGFPFLTIMITAYATFDKAVLATKLGAYDFLAKPFTPDELRYVIRKACRTLYLTEKARKLEEEKRRARFEFISVLAHELKAPLNSVEGYADMMINRTAGPDIGSYDQPMERVKVRIDAMRKMITDLLDLTRIESGTRNRTIEETDLREIAAGVLENCAQMAAKRNITVKLQAAEALNFPVDRSEMEVLFTNFVTNGIKYNRDGGSLTVSLARREGAVEMAFIDTGIGMTAEEQQNLFKEFSRIKNRKTRDIQGSGLGLSISRKIIDLYEGTVEVESTADKGSTFRVILPVKK